MELTGSILELIFLNPKPYYTKNVGNRKEASEARDPPRIFINRNDEQATFRS